MTKVKLVRVKDETHDTRSFIWEKPAGLVFVAGQYLHWTLPHPSPDERGEERPFTISASPTEEFLMLTTKFAPEEGSTFKGALQILSPGAEIDIDAPSGEFVLPADSNTPIVFLGGGVGITPFRSIIKFATDTKLTTPLTLIYANKTPGDIIFRTEFDGWAKENRNFKLAYTVDTPDGGWTSDVGRLTGAMIKKYVSDLSKPFYYICGPKGMIDAYTEILTSTGIKPEQVRTENFTGYK